MVLVRGLYLILKPEKLRLKAACATAPAVHGGTQKEAAAAWWRGDKRMEYYIISKTRTWPEEFSQEECVFLDIMADSSATSIVRIWGNMESTEPKWWPAVFYSIYDTERNLPCDILPNLKPGRRLDLKTQNYIHDT